MPYDGDMNQEITPILQVCKIVGDQAKLARALQVTSPTVNQWVKGERPIPADRCSAMEALVHGAVKCEQLNESLSWIRIPDKSWKWHPKGRPVVDPTRDAKPRKKVEA